MKSCFFRLESGNSLALGNTLDFTHACMHACMLQSTCRHKPPQQTRFGKNKTCPQAFSSHHTTYTCLMQMRLLHNLRNRCQQLGSCINRAISIESAAHLAGLNIPSHGACLSIGRCSRLDPLGLRRAVFEPRA